MGTSRMSRARSRTTLAAAAALAFAAAASLVTASQAGAVASTTTCAQVEVITARGQGEPLSSGDGYVLGPMVTALQKGLSQTVRDYPLPYDAGTDVIASSNAGIQLLTDHLVAMRKQCPKMKEVVLGFSLGAIVAGETFAPTTRYPGITSYALPTSIDPAIAAVVVFGDGRFTAGMSPQDYGTYQSGVSGQHPRPLNAFARFGDHVRDVCNLNDGVCQAIPSWQAQASAHQDYVKYSNDLVNYVSYELGTINPS